MTKALKNKQDVQREPKTKSSVPSVVSGKRPPPPQSALQVQPIGPSEERDQAALASWTSILEHRNRVADEATGSMQPSQGSPSTIIQAKLTLGPAGDQYEQEADSVAKQVVGKLNNPQGQPTQRQEEEEMQMKPLSTLQRQEEEEMMAKRLQRQEEEEMMAKERGDTLAGGPISSELEDEIQGAKGGGQPMADNVRDSMEQAFGADFGGVRVHTGAQSDNLNKAIQARAFTTGQDVFFRSGEYSPSSAAGQELLAHELTHVVQQNGSQLRPKRRIQRMAFENTNWEAAKSARISKGGGGGAIIIKDKGDPIVVKASEDSPGEAMVFSQLFGGTMSGGEHKEGDWQVETPGVRMADNMESARIKAVLDNLLPDSDEDPRIARSKAALMDGSPTVIFSYAQGGDFGKYLYKAKKDEKGPKFKERLKVVSQLWTNPGFMTLLGKTTAVDLFMGNQDRVFLFNPDNFMVHMGKKKKRLTLIDNVFDAPGQGGKFGDKSDFDDWVGARHYSEELNDFTNVTQDFKDDNFEKLAQAAVGMIYDEIRYGGGSVGKELADIMRAQMDENFGAMATWFANGLAEAKGGMLISVHHLEQAMEGNDINVGSKQHQILRHLKARKLFLTGASAEEAWRLSSSFVGGNIRGNRGGLSIGTGRNIGNN